MPKKLRVRTVMDSQQVKISKRCLKSARHYFCHIFWSLWKEITSKDSLLLVSQILRLLVNILTPDDKYFVSVKSSLWRNQFKCNYLEIKKYFPSFLLRFRNLHKFGILLNKW